ncbi:MAG: AbrB/MazE/SpoVT family DNA-binding domain-containing protein [archaeon]
MKRKVIQIAKSTSVVSLPKSWTQEYNINKGDEVFLYQIKNNILIKTLNQKSDEVVLDITGLDSDLTWRYLITAYRKGSEIIKIRYNQDATEILQTYIKDLVGMAAIKQKENIIVLKDFFYNYSEINANSLIKRIFKLVIDMSNDILVAIKDKDVNSLKGVNYRDYNINKFTNLCLRILNKNMCEDYNKSLSMYKFVSLLEEIGDEYRRMALVFSRNVTNLDNETLELFNEVNILLNECYNLFYGYSKDKLIIFHDKANVTLDRLKKSYKARKNGQVLSSLDTILHLIKNLCEESLVVSI